MQKDLEITNFNYVCLLFRKVGVRFWQDTVIYDSC